jgi:hypothetical protein
MPRSVYTDGIVCREFQGGRCSRSDMKFLAEHGNNAMWSHRSYQCRTCKTLDYHMNPEFVKAARENRIAKDLFNLGNDGAKRWKGFETPRGGKI